MMRQESIRLKMALCITFIAMLCCNLFVFQRTMIGYISANVIAKNKAMSKYRYTDSVFYL